VDGKQLAVVGTAEIELSIAAYACCVDFVVIENIAHNVILGLEALNNLQAVVDLSNSTLSIANNLVTVPLIRRIPARNILRTLTAVTIKPMHEIRIPVKIAANYQLCPSMVESLMTSRAKPILVAKVFVDPKSYVTVCQVANISENPYKLNARTALATITPADLLSTLDEQLIPQTTLDVGSVNFVQEITQEEKIAKLRKMGFKIIPDEYTKAQYAELVDLFI